MGAYSRTLECAFVFSCTSHKNHINIITSTKIIFTLFHHLDYFPVLQKSVQ